MDFGEKYQHVKIYEARLTLTQGWERRSRQLEADVMDGNSGVVISSIDGRHCEVSEERG